MSHIWILIVVTLIAINKAMVGSFLVVRKSTMMGDAISHAVLPGIVLAFFITHSLSSASVFVGATLMGIFSIFMITFLNKTANLQGDASIGIVFTFLFAVGVILISYLTKKTDLDQDCILYGEVVHIPIDTIYIKGKNFGPKALYIHSCIFIINVAIISIFYKFLYSTSFDESFSRSIGISATKINYLILSLTALNCVAAFEAVGAILTVSFLAIPTAAAFLLAHTFEDMVKFSIILGILGAMGGYYVAYEFDLPAAGSMSFISGLIFVFAFMIRKLSSKNNE